MCVVLCLSCKANASGWRWAMMILRIGNGKICEKDGAEDRWPAMYGKYYVGESIQSRRLLAQTVNKTSPVLRVLINSDHFNI